VGVGKPEEHQDLANFVLSRMKRTDEQMQGIEKAFLSLCDIMRGSTVDDIMTKYNGESNKNGKH
jgi:peptidyl-tRNA hydrolase